MYEINSRVGADTITHRIAGEAKAHFKIGLVGAEFGVAYGGGVETIAKLWTGCGVIHGFDTFQGHPVEIAYSPRAWEANCMDVDYAAQGRERLSEEYIRGELSRQGLDNVFLHKGLIHDSSLYGIDALHYVLLDLDFIAAMVFGWTLVKDRIVPGGFLCLHDVVPRGNMIGLWGLYQEIMASGQWSLEGEYPDNYLAVLRKL
ncbi:MAG TPA: hypothetical protein VMQ76_02735 [Terracidiphilus sp.]|nr:hypothetical protein [Terracidiphilus sp.]